MWMKIFLISGTIIFLMALHGLNNVGWIDAPEFMLDPVFAACLLISSGIVIVILTIPSQIIFLLLLLLFVWGVFVYVYAHFVLEVITIQPFFMQSIMYHLMI